jgi:GNAT superfamily N-acetyltransferase
VTVPVRQARRGDAEAILPLYEWLFAPPGGEPPAWDTEAALERLRETISSPHSTVFLGDDEGRLVGICSAYLDLNSVRYGLRCWVEDLAVDPDRRSEGIGAALLGAAREWARDQGATHLELDSGADRADAHRFYERERPSWTGMQYSWWLP